MGSCANFATAFFKVSRSSEVGLKDDIFAAAVDGITCIRVPVIYGGAYQLFTEGSHPDHTRKPAGSLTTGIKDAADLGAYYFVPSIDSLRKRALLDGALWHDFALHRSVRKTQADFRSLSGSKPLGGSVDII